MNIIHCHIATRHSPTRQRYWLALGLAFGIGISLYANHYGDRFNHAPPGTLKYLIMQGEAGTKGYNSYNRGSLRCAKSNRQMLNLTSMSIQQIQYYQSLPACTAQKLLAVGHYQMVPETLNQAVKSLNIPANAPFTPDLQDRIFALYLAREKQPAINRWICEGKNLRAAAHAVAGEWAIFQTPYTQRGLYDGLGNNKARISSYRVLNALLHARLRYVTLTTLGTPMHKAYAIALGVE